VKERNFQIKLINMKNKHLFVNHWERMAVNKTNSKRLFLPLHLHILQLSQLDHVKYKMKIQINDTVYLVPSQDLEEI
jgi:hypothetical protein